ncbi:MAG TPA: hypothetical protein VHW91_00165 [Candidatus Dormibacteraeota bacterium]|nr:hypothetical protein [Candidatus Dormibacteraeota bacterium]
MRQPTAAPVRRWWIIGGIALVLLLVIGYVLGGAAAAGGPVGDADRALRGTIDHENAVVDVLNQDPLKNVNLSTGTSDVPKAKAALTAYRQKLSSVEPTVRADRNALVAVRPRLQSSVLTLPEQGTIGHDRQRVDAALSALASAERGIVISKKQVDFLNALFDAASSFDAVGKSMQANDLNGTATQLPATGATVKKAMTLAQPPDVPAAFMPMLQGMQKAATDLQALVSAIQANDYAGTQKYVAAVEADGQALQAVDQSAIDKAENDLFQPLIDNYNRKMKLVSS